MAPVQFLQVLLLKILLGVCFVTSKPVTVSTSTSWSAFDILPNENDLTDLVEEQVHRLGLRNQSNLWPGGVIPYVIKDEYTQEVRNLIVKSMKEIEDDVGTNTSKCIQYVPRTNEENYLAIRRGVGCHTQIGYWDNGVHYSTISKGCETKGIIMHELIHSLGFYHEQDRYDRDTYIAINETNIEGGTASRNFKLHSETETDTLGTPYDFESIMHYEPYNFAKVLSYPVITPKPGYATDINMGQRFSLSKWDVIDIQRLYGCQEDASHIFSKKSDKNALVWCNFAKDSCDLEQSVNTAETQPPQGTREGNNQIPWVVRYGPTNDGPIAGFSTGVDSFLYASASNTAENISENATAAKSVLDHLQNSSSAAERTERDMERQDSVEISSTTSVASIFTPFLVFDDDDDRDICIDIKIFQPTRTSYLSIYLTGLNGQRLQIVSYQGKFKEAWVPVPITATVPMAHYFRLEFEAVLTNSTVSLDDILVYKGACD